MLQGRFRVGGRYGLAPQWPAVRRGPALSGRACCLLRCASVPQCAFRPCNAKRRACGRALLVCSAVACTAHAALSAILSSVQHGRQRMRCVPHQPCAWSKARGGAQTRYYREKLGVDPGDPAGVRAVVEAYIQVPAPAMGTGVKLRGRLCLCHLVSHTRWPRSQPL